MTTPRDPTPQELTAMQALMQTNNVGIMPVVFNGAQRYAIVVMNQGVNGPYVQVIGILPVAEDNICNMQGQPAFSTPPATIAAGPTKLTLN